MKFDTVNIRHNFDQAEFEYTAVAYLLVDDPEWSVEHCTAFVTAEERRELVRELLHPVDGPEEIGVRCDDLEAEPAAQ